ncbi:hypothetical protein HUG17_7726 [Dermatophagoides farinae]|uniref:Uncharacterized protein n=1 Tax=Dermatophagoides farinae TaxID=6954 RepID=A0A9D4NWW4_DERFA|nr:hypothetical protein HUG17_7726 [Dermatophagoides farinae]
MVTCSTASTKKCQDILRKYSPLKKALVLPYLSEYSFECYACLFDDKLLDSIWKFIPVDESRLYNIRRFKNDNEKVVQIMRSGKLVQRKLQKSGTYYCVYQSKILAIYRVTILHDFERKTFIHMVDKHKPIETFVKEYSIVHEEGPTLQIFFHLLYETQCNRNRYHSLGQKVFICVVKMADVSNQTFLTINNDESQLIHKLREFSEIPCADPLIDRLVWKSFRKQFLSNVRIVISYGICRNTSAIRFRKSESKMIPFMHMKAMFQSTEHFKRKIHEYTVISCFRFQSSDIRKIVPIRWNKIKFDYDIEEMYRHGPKPSKELSQWISPLYIKRSSNGRMVIDWLGNIHVKSLEKFDLNFIYRCHNDTTSESKKLAAIRIIRKHWQLPSISELFEEMRHQPFNLDHKSQFHFNHRID